MISMWLLLFMLETGETRTVIVITGVGRAEEEGHADEEQDDNDEALDHGCFVPSERHDYYDDADDYDDNVDHPASSRAR